MPGGWIGDAVLGSQRAVICGAILIILGNVALAAASHTGLTGLLFIGLMLLVFGVGLLKPNISVLVHSLYPGNESNRDAGFALYFMGINIGSLLGTLLLPVAALMFGWTTGFIFAAAGMVIGLVLFQRYKGLLPKDFFNHPNIIAKLKLEWWTGKAMIIGIILLSCCGYFSLRAFSANSLAILFSIVMGIAAVIYTASLLSELLSKVVFG